MSTPNKATTSINQKSQEILNFLKRIPQQYLSTEEIENKFSHYSKEELHSLLHTLMSQGCIGQQYSFGTETWRLNGSGTLPNFRSTQPTTRLLTWNTSLKQNKSNPVLQQTNSSQVIHIIHIFCIIIISNPIDLLQLNLSLLKYWNTVEYIL